MTAPAQDTGAVSETLGGAGILFKEKDYHKTAGLVERVLSDESLSTTLKTLQAQRIERYKKDSQPEKLFALLRDV